MADVFDAVLGRRVPQCSRKRSKGFRVVNTRTGAVLSETFPRRAPARAIATKLYAEGVPTGVQQVTDYE